MSVGLLNLIFHLQSGSSCNESILISESTLTLVGAQHYFKATKSLLYIEGASNSVLPSLCSKIASYHKYFNIIPYTLVT